MTKHYVASNLGISIGEIALWLAYCDLQRQMVSGKNWDLDNKSWHKQQQQLHIRQITNSGGWKVTLTCQGYKRGPKPHAEELETLINAY